MRQSNASEEFTRNNLRNSNREGNQNDNEISDQDDDQVNCPLIFKTCLVSLVTCGILAFVISFASQINDSPDLVTEDFIKCGDHSNVRRLLKSYAYEKTILGLLISAVVISFGLTVFLLYLSYNYCQCFGDCYTDKNESQSQGSENIDINQYEIELKKRIVSNILMPKDSYQRNQSQHKNRQRQSGKQQQRQRVNKQKRRRFKRSRQEIQRFNQNYSKYIGNSQQNECDCQCDDCSSCLAYCLGCLWCRSCFDAHHYHFYNSKKQQYTYWIAYMVKTFLFGSALAYVIRVYVSLKQMDYCQSDNAKFYANNIEVPMIIGIVTAVIDVFGYIHLFVQGTLLQIVQDTLHEKPKSQHSDSDSDGQSLDDHQKKQAKKYQRSEQSYSTGKQSGKKTKKPLFKNQHQNQEPVQNPTDDNLLRSLKNQKNQRQRQPESKDSDSFFIRLKTLGNRYLDNIDNQTDQNQDKYRTKDRKDISSQGSYQDSNKKPRIEVPQLIDKLPIKNIPKMKRQQSEKQQTSLRQSIGIQKMLNQQKEIKEIDEKNVYKNVQNYLNTKTYGKFGSFNKDGLQ